MEWYCLVTLTTSKCVARICQHQLSFLYVRRGACECRHYARQLWCFTWQNAAPTRRRLLRVQDTLTASSRETTCGRNAASPPQPTTDEQILPYFAPLSNRYIMLPIELLKYTHDRAIFVSPWLSTSLWWWCQTANHINKSQMTQETHKQMNSLDKAQQLTAEIFPFPRRISTNLPSLRHITWARIYG